VHLLCSAYIGQVTPLWETCAHAAAYYGSRIETQRKDAKNLLYSRRLPNCQMSHMRNVKSLNGAHLSPPWPQTGFNKRHICTLKRPSRDKKQKHCTTDWERGQMNSQHLAGQLQRLACFRLQCAGW